jgi:hypothetical protein
LASPLLQRLDDLWRKNEQVRQPGNKHSRQREQGVKPIVFCEHCEDARRARTQERNPRGKGQSCDDWKGRLQREVDREHRVLKGGELRTRQDLVCGGATDESLVFDVYKLVLIDCIDYGTALTKECA